MRKVFLPIETRISHWGSWKDQYHSRQGRRKIQKFGRHSLSTVKFWFKKDMYHTYKFTYIRHFFGLPYVFWIQHIIFFLNPTWFDLRIGKCFFNRKFAAVWKILSIPILQFFFYIDLEGAPRFVGPYEIPSSSTHSGCFCWYGSKLMELFCLVDPYFLKEKAMSYMYFRTKRGKLNDFWTNLSNSGYSGKCEENFSLWKKSKLHTLM